MKSFKFYFSLVWISNQDQIRINFSINMNFHRWQDKTMKISNCLIMLTYIPFQILNRTKNHRASFKI